MKITNVLAFEEVYPKLKSLSLDIKTAYALMKIHQMALIDTEFYKKSLSVIIEKYGEKDENGVLKISKEDNYIPIATEQLDECQKEIYELENLQVSEDYKKYSFSLDEFSNIEITPKELEGLAAFLKE